MSATVTPLRQAPGNERVTQARVALSEFTKLRSLRSTMYTLIITGIITLGLGVAASALTESHWLQMNPQDRATFEPVSMSLLGVRFGILVIGVLGVLIVTNEYSTGMVRSTFAAVPMRLPVLWAKVGVYMSVALAVSIPAVVLSFFLGQSLLAPRHINIAFSHSGVPGAVFGTALYLSLAGLLGLGIGAILRNTAGAISAFTALMFVIEPLVELLPKSTQNSINPFLPANAGGAILRIVHEPHTLAPWTGLGVFAGYTAAVIAVAAVLLMRRDV